MELKKPAERFPTKEDGEIEIYGQMGTLPVQVLNISKTGALISLTPTANQESTLPTAGDILSLTVFLKELSKTHYLSAEIVWNRDSSFGINFIDKEKILERMMAKAGMI